MTTPLRLIVGLGNPGAEHRDTRHNAGFWLLDQLARRFGGSFQHDKKYAAELCQVSVEGRSLWLMKPLTFMNRSGFSVAGLSRFYKLMAAELLVAHDELDLPPGVARLKVGGGHGGHNGLRDIIAQLGKQSDFVRLRLGIGHPGNAAQVVAYVLRKPPPDERAALDDAIAAAIDVLPAAAGGDLAAAMNTLHRRKPPALA